MKNSNPSPRHIAVIGGGAAGMIAAITAARQGATVTILERQKRISRKLLASGNGRCNMTNMDCSSKNYHGSDPDFVGSALGYFSVEKTLEFFHSLGVCTIVEDDGRVFPLTGQASTVLDVLRYEIERSSITARVNAGVESIRRQGDGFQIQWPGGKERADRVVMTTGGKAMPQLGGTATGVDILKKMGHREEPVFPALVPLKADPHYGPRVKGVRVYGQVSLVVAGRKFSREEGEIHFAEYGLSGPPIIQLSLAAGRALHEQHVVTLTVDLFPTWSRNQLHKEIERRFAARPEAPLDFALIGLVNKRLVPVILSDCNIPQSRKAARLVLPAETGAIVDRLKNWSFTITGSLSWNEAQVMAGGIRTADFSAETLESHRVKGLYAAGEVLDITGDCGGYNLQWAWSSGYVAGLNAARG